MTIKIWCDLFTHKKKSSIIRSIRSTLYNEHKHKIHAKKLLPLLLIFYAYKLFVMAPKPNQTKLGLVHKQLTRYIKKEENKHKHSVSQTHTCRETTNFSTVQPRNGHWKNMFIHKKKTNLLKLNLYLVCCETFSNFQLCTPYFLVS